MGVHIPARMEELMTYKTQNDIVGFSSVLNDIKKILREKTVLIAALDSDEEKRLKNHKLLADDAKKHVLKALEGDILQDGLIVLPSILQQFEAGYQAIEMEFMNDVSTTLITFSEPDDESESE